MRKLALIIAVFGLWLPIVSAQDVVSTEQGTDVTPQDSKVSKEEASNAFFEKYRLQVSKLGYDGIGVETILDNWEKVDPENKMLLLARYNFFMAKAQSNKVVTKSERKYLGNEAVFSLKDSLGNDVYYFQTRTYNDSLFRIALDWLDKAIGLYPKELYYREVRCSGLILYEGESPDMALADALGLIGFYYSDPTDWEYDGAAVDREGFLNHVQKACYSFYILGTPSGYKAFKSLSDKMLEYEKDNTDFLSNIGTYYLVAEKNQKTALKYYNKVLKIKPDDYIAAKNCVLISRDRKDTKMEKKYLPALIASTEDEGERLSAETRLKML